MRQMHCRHHRYATAKEQGRGSAYNKDRCRYVHGSQSVTAYATTHEDAVGHIEQSTEEQP